MNTQIENLAFVYVQKRSPFRAVCVEAEEARACYDKNRRWVHIATIDPKTWIAYLLNNPLDRAATVESLFCATPLKGLS